MEHPPLVDEGLPTVNTELIAIYKLEYDKLKDEQTMRIHFRDSMIPLSLGIFGAIVSFAMSKSEFAYALLLVPLVSLILGWVYIVNDEKVTQLGFYMRFDLAPKLAECVGASEKDAILGWEVKVRSDVNRAIRKRTQLLVDFLAFVVPGLFSCGLFYLSSLSLPWYYGAVLVVVVACSGYIGWAILMFTDRSIDDMRREAEKKKTSPSPQVSTPVGGSTPAGGAGAGLQP
jgi:hypothetical protein